MAIKDKFEKIGIFLKKVFSAFRVFKPRAIVFVFFMVFFFIAEIFLVMTTTSSCEFDLEKSASICENATITGIPFIEMTIILGVGSYIISALLVGLYRRLFVKTFF